MKHINKHHIEWDFINMNTDFEFLYYHLTECEAGREETAHWILGYAVYNPHDERKSDTWACAYLSEGNLVVEFPKQIFSGWSPTPKRKPTKEDWEALANHYKQYAIPQGKQKK